MSKAERTTEQMCEACWMHNDPECGYECRNLQRKCTNNDLIGRGYELAEKDLGWISVKDRLPDTTEYVFTCVEIQGRPQCVGFHFYKDGKWWEGYEEDTVGAVEYWMPIPELPKI